MVFLIYSKAEKIHHLGDKRGWEIVGINDNVWRESEREREST